jgi:hypothetical protein
MHIQEVRGGLQYNHAYRQWPPFQCVVSNGQKDLQREALDCRREAHERYQVRLCAQL